MTWYYDRIWVIEMQYDRRGLWHATVGVQLTRGDARRVKADWQERNPNDRFRLRRYQRALAGKGDDRG